MGVIKLEKEIQNLSLTLAEEISDTTLGLEGLEVQTQLICQDCY